ncbi:TLC domain-containing protein At5g14285-like [Actinidia eriantha]|uniref:TLC domain-containing protein At5g14285-like n=1 Tax=Actinidia eriantha TaxID=165200 RepID=UPI002585B99F|nr:TLC domain-containing protein At5g14285-like [Actinidia eriantha]
MATLTVFSLHTFLLMFTAIYLLGYYVIFRNWPGLSRAETSSCLLCLAHGTPAAVLATFSLLHLENPSNFASQNTPFQNMVLEFTIAAFFIDLLHFLLFVPTSYMYIAHHVATIYVFSTCRYIINHGAFPILVVLVLGEVTSLCHNTWRISGFRRAHSQVAARVQEFSPLFYGFYTVVRGILAPVFVCKMAIFYLRGGGDGLVPMWAWVSWTVVIAGGNLFSIVWVFNMWLGLWGERGNQKKLKELGEEDVLIFG